MQTEKLPKNSHKQFYDNQKTHQIKLYISPQLKKDNNFNIDDYYQSRYFLNPAYKTFNQKISGLRINKRGILDDEPFYRICITLFSITISATAVIKATNIAHVTPSTIHKTQQLNIQSSELKLMKLSDLGGRNDGNNVSHELLVANIQDTDVHELVTFTNQAVKHKKLILTVCLEIPQKAIRAIKI